MSPTLNPLLDIHPEVAEALAAGRPVVALESTIISHGMPWPDNARTALAVQAEVRAHGAVPATIAVIDGRLKAGLDAAQIERLGQAGQATAKASRRDLPLLVAGVMAGGTGATTVAATMIIAALAGIRIFATGGIGGVHRGAETSLDISADLQELARTPVAVVCAGIKSILDLGLTLEYLETHGVPVIGYGTDRLPAFYSRDSAFGVDARLDSPAQVAAVMQAQWALGLRSGLVVANPVPAEHAMPRETIDAAITQALAEAQAQGVAGKAATPFLLARVSALTGGQSLASNIALILANARLAAQVAVAHAAAGG
ncbi:pseudouridine-5'-phosphate glycosidase [Aquabacterium sp. OR-4]|uniref:pseudouridine-5'-phosphate glycosidase n=1 Tax=Aquabacterium sp. OR-4 TaxID=2978127 RepID=UPI0021B38197|nr:pseudouridine-5'-phosphate glycosidase [Aquabacterium sp. OR-4]MDT7833855.1 pseudouridine-5'-phosphate glycosidase [Aquabacterium sp. OR-4]